MQPESYAQILILDQNGDVLEHFPRALVRMDVDIDYQDVYSGPPVGHPHLAPTARVMTGRRMELSVQALIDPKLGYMHKRWLPAFTKKGKHAK